MNKGLIQKYEVIRKDGKEVTPCFVLEVKDNNSRTAMRTYANLITNTNPQLAQDLNNLCDEYEQFLSGKNNE